MENKKETLKTFENAEIRAAMLVMLLLVCMVCSAGLYHSIYGKSIASITVSCVVVIGYLAGFDWWLKQFRREMVQKLFFGQSKKILEPARKEKHEKRIG